MTLSGAIWFRVSPPLRAAAAWGLGQGQVARPASLLALAIDDDLLVRLHAAVATAGFSDDCVGILMSWLEEGQPRKAATAAFLLRRRRRIDNLLDACESGGTARVWAIRALGGLPETELMEIAGGRLTQALEEVLAPQWIGQDDRLEVEGEAGVEALDIQRIRFDPSFT